MQLLLEVLVLSPCIVIQELQVVVAGLFPRQEKKDSGVRGKFQPLRNNFWGDSRSKNRCKHDSIRPPGMSDGRNP